MLFRLHSAAKYVQFYNLFFLMSPWKILQWRWNSVRLFTFLYERVKVRRKQLTNYTIFRVPKSALDQNNFLYIFLFQKCPSLEHLAPLWWEIVICAYRLFSTKLNAQELKFEAFFDIIRIFGTVWPSKVNQLCRFCTFSYFENGHLWSPLAPLCGEIDVCAH